MSKVITRKADSLDIPFLQRKLASTDWEQVDLKRSLVWVSEYKGRPFGFIALRLVWQVEPLMIFEEEGIPTSALGRGARLLHKEVEKYLSDPEQNKSGIYWYFLYTDFDHVIKWANRLGWKRCYAKGQMFCKWFTKTVK